MELGEIGESTLSKGNQTTVPKAVRKALRLQPGDKIKWYIRDQHVEVGKREVK